MKRTRYNSLPLRWMRRHRWGLGIMVGGGAIFLVGMVLGESMSSIYWEHLAGLRRYRTKDALFSLGVILMVIILGALHFSRHQYIAALLGANRQSDELHAQHQSLKRRLKGMEKITNCALEGILIVNPDLIVTYVNQAWAKTFGYLTTNKLLDCDITLFHTRTQLKDYVYPFLDLVRDLGRYSHTLHCKRIDGSEFSAEITAMTYPGSKAQEGFVLYMMPLNHSSPKNPSENAMNNQTNSPDTPLPEEIHSLYEDNPSIQSILDVFIDSIPPTLQTMRSALKGSDFATLQSEAHQLKGTGGGYGYPMITEVAVALETAARQNDVELVQIHLKQLHSIGLAIQRGWNSPTAKKET